MSTNRTAAMAELLHRELVPIELPASKISEFFGSNVFSDAEMRKHLSEEAYNSIRHSIENGQKIDRKIADQVAASMKAWAMGKGATHYTHWFQPLTGATAEKHDSFFTAVATAVGVETFSGSALVQQEPDASSFPSGGIRSTFEARGYTAWDPSSPAFIMDSVSGKTLCIPTIFVSYTGEALDYKAPLLKSLHLLEEAAVPVCQYFDKNVNRVNATLGWEQEYFLVDEALFLARPDLSICGRSLVGHYPAKGQQLEDHYFGTIPERIYNYMVDFETEAHKLGIPLRTRHNEVAPGQYECAPLFEEASIAVDHNLLLMDVMEKVARRHKLRVLFHEKPFAGVNGSGKHNNWSMGTDTGKNLLSPGKTPRTNLQFLTFFINTIKAVHEYADLLRVSIAAAGNDHRLGANEAPPAIISAFIGTALREVLNEIENRVTEKDFDESDKTDLRLDIHNKIPDLLLDNTDRNRTSPFAFTGNKFEFRAVGSSANCSKAMTTLNTIVATQLIAFRTEVDALIKGGENKDSAILKVLRRYITESKNILFEGDNYSEEWAKEATEKRGLSNVKTTPEAIEFYGTDKAKKVFVSNNILSDRELHARQEIEFEEYAKKIQIEARIYGELVYNYVLPASITYQNELLDNILKLKAVGLNEAHYKEQLDLAQTITLHINHLRSSLERMVEERKRANHIEHAREKAYAYCNDVKPLFDTIREHADMLERYLPDASWPLPKYRELLFVK
ncbi:MAG TPA: glutamine synthetase III [Chitinophagales bacterium]|nr:glutamine synthetase III [Chitinophagales bacterium]HMZ90597.1 glutamine synthetase III [Chitinophagales bacterium]HNE46185.1 glutamine synthetase III [Chitinophagales bacterium]HNF70638.1 glutamine synthetase III [Chitinophagales bacterium]HNI54527.1 glutamine synthetase III [Chitinophagales bacterium]